jgi:hypothetical protein
MAKQTITKPSANTLIDQTFLGQMVDVINDISDNYAKASSSIFDTKRNKAISTYFGGFTLATLQIDVTQTLSATKMSSHTEKIGFGKTFLSPPVVVATIQSKTASKEGSTPSQIMTSVTVNAVNESGADVTILIDPIPKAATVTYYVNVIAIGLAPPLQV